MEIFPCNEKGIKLLSYCTLDLPSTNEEFNFDKQGRKKTSKIMHPSPFLNEMKRVTKHYVLYRQ